MRAGTWIAGLVFFGLLFGGCVSQAKYLELQKSYVDRGESLARANAMLDEYNEKVNMLSMDLRLKETLLQKREDELALVSQVRTKIDDSWKSTFTQVINDFQKDEGVTYDSKTGALVLDGSVFFDSGSAQVKEGAKKTLLKIANSLMARKGSIQILGHTDSDPIIKTRDKWPLGNLELSGARALNVLLFLKEKGGIPGERMSFAGCGEYKPRVANDTKENKKLNRRVEILVNEISE